MLLLLLLQRSCCPISLFRVGRSWLLFGVRAMAVAVVGGIPVDGLGIPGDVGGLASGAELMEWEPRLCVLLLLLLLALGDSGVRVFVNVIVTVNGSPAK